MTTRALAVALAVVTMPGVAGAQDSARVSSSATVLPAHYHAGTLRRALLGSGWRDAWTTPVTVPVLDVSAWNGGLTFDKRGGGNQSIVLHFTEKDGWKEYRFRSVNKFPTQGYPVFAGTAFGSLMQDQISIYLPAGPLVVPPLLRSIGALTVEPELYVLGDAPQLGALNDTVSGMLGMLELKGEEGPDDTPGFAGSSKIRGTEEFLEDIASSREHRLDEREFLAVRLLDMMVNDPDRTPDNFDWARFGDKGAYTWRPLARDRDQAFMDARGLVNSFIVSRVWPKQMPFDSRYRLSGLIYSTHSLDRRLLQRLTADDVREVAETVRRSVSDAVIADAIAQLPAEWRAGTTADDRLASTLRARREALPEFAMKFYRWLATEVDVHGTAEPDRFDVVRHADGRVTVTVGDPERPATIVRRDDGTTVTISAGEVGTGAAAPYFRRTFLPGETNEVRLYGGAGDDIAVVRGAASNAIAIRIIGAKGNDVLADSAGGGGTTLYDAEGDNRFIPAPGTRIDTRAWKPLAEVVGIRVGTNWVPDWGRKQGWAPAFDYETAAGLVVGGGLRVRQHGFRRLPYHWSAGANAFVGSRNGRVGVTAFADIRPENSPRAFRIEGRATQIESARFFGYGNDSPAIARKLSLVDQTVYAVEPSLVRFIGWRAREDEPSKVHGVDTTRYSGLRPMVGDVSVGASLGWIDPDPVAGSPLLASGTGSSAFGLAGARVALELDRTDDDAVPTSGWTLKADAAAYPKLSGLDGAFGTALARGTVYLPLGARGGPHVALRAGGSLARGEYPAQFASTIGGRSSLRGYSWHRFAGDAAVNGGAELRVPVGTVNLFVRSQLGLFALADAGRVWFDGTSPGGWHSGVGGGFWLAAFGKAVSVAYARGEENKLYLRF